MIIDLLYVSRELRDIALSIPAATRGSGRDTPRPTAQALPSENTSAASLGHNKLASLPTVFG
jgi:hypothetical protein